MKLRPYQLDLKADIHQAWQDGNKNVLAVMPCRSGKTALFSNIMSEESGNVIAMVHRSEIVTQISLTLGRWGIDHNVIGPQSLVKQCVKEHIIEFGRNYINPSSKQAVASVQTLISKNSDLRWFKQVGLWVTDECHHLIKGSTWHKCVEMFPNAKGLGVTATPCRADGKGLGIHSDGVFHKMVVGELMRPLINMGMIADYRIFCPSSDIDLSAVKVGASGDFIQDQLRAAVHKSHLVGDIVEHYRKYVDGKLAIVFAVDVESAEQQAAAFNAAGIPAKAVSGKTDPSDRERAIRELRRGDIRVIVNCDLFGEGTDLPAVEAVIFGRPTDSYPLFYQQFCRALTKTENKTHGIIIDPVSNIKISVGGRETGRHPLPDSPQQWTLDRRERRSSNGNSVSTIRTCEQCFGVYDKIKNGPMCPYCGNIYQPAERSGPRMVDGDLCELTPDILAAMRGDIDKIYARPKIPYGASKVIENSILKHHREHIAAIEELKHVMACWAHGKHDLRSAQREFYLTFGIDVLSAQAVSMRDAVKLKERVANEIERLGYKIPCQH